VNNKVDVSQQCALAAKEANCILARMTRNTDSGLREVTVHFFLALVRLHLAYCIQCGAISERHQGTKASSTESHKAGQAAGVQTL